MIAKARKPSGPLHSTAVAGAKAWEANGGGNVIGLTCAQAARDVLAAAADR